MAAWRMAFRAGTNGYDLWPECRRLGIAIIEYGPLDDTDLSKYELGEPVHLWKQLAPTQQTSLRRFVGEMKPRDVIYVKSGPKIVGKGTIRGPYRFDGDGVVEHDGVFWRHQREVKWEITAPEVDNPTNQNIVTVKPLTDSDVQAIEIQYTRTAPAVSRPATDSDIEGLRYEIVTMTTRRSRRLRDAAFENANGVCAVCERDFSKLLRGRGVRVLQVHHTRMISKRNAESVTKLSDLVVVCANCHLLLHLDPKAPMTVSQLRKMLRAD